MSSIYRFWMVKGGGPSFHKHETRAAAEAEAMRLAGMDPGKLFYVMEAVAAHRCLAAERIAFREEDPEIPF